MYSASDYRGMARRALKNYWWLAVGVTWLASILGGTSSSFTPSFSLTVNGDDLTQYYPEALRHALRVFLPVSGIVSLAQFVIGGNFILFRLRERILGIDIDDDAQVAQERMADLLADTEFAGYHRHLLGNMNTPYMRLMFRFSSYMTRQANPFRYSPSG